MRKVNTSAITTSIGMPLKKGSLDTLQLAEQENVDAVIKSIIGQDYDPSKVYLLWGCKNTGSGSSFVIGAGAVFYAGEVYQVPASTFTTAGGQVPVCNINTTYLTGADSDPVNFTDGLARNIHEIRQVVIAAGTSGTGLVDYANLAPVSGGTLRELRATFNASETVTFDRERSIFYVAAGSGSAFTLHFDLTNAVVGVGVRVKFPQPNVSTLAVDCTTTANVIKEDGDLSAAANHTNVLYAVYCGLNETGTPEISYHIKQVS